MLAKEKTAVLVVIIISSSFLMLLPHAEASEGQADVYVIQLAGIPGFLGIETNPANVSAGSVDACILDGDWAQVNVARAHPSLGDCPPYYTPRPYVVTSWAQYKGLVETSSGSIIVNTHGEFLPVPDGYAKESWFDKIAEGMIHRRLTWVHTGGYTFYHVWYQGSGDGGVWEENINGRTGGAGFNRLMSKIGLTNVDLWAPSGHESERVFLSLDANGQIGDAWRLKNGIQRDPLSSYDSVDMGAPLKEAVFGEYLLMPLYSWQDSQTQERYYTGAAIAFAKAGERYKNGNGPGAYVHIGTRNVYYANQKGSDFVRGFIGVAMALWIESTSFDVKMSSDQDPNWSQRAALTVQPVISGVYHIAADNYAWVRIVFVVHGMTEAPAHQGIDLYYDIINFNVFSLQDPYNDVRMCVDLDSSRDGYGDNARLLNIRNDVGGSVDYLISGASWFFSPMVAADPIAAGILWGIDGIMLFSDWREQVVTNSFSGTESYDPWIGFIYNPFFTYEDPEPGQTMYTEFTSFVMVQLKIPDSTRAGWHNIPLSYEIIGDLNWADGGHMQDSDVEDTLNLAVFFGNSQGQRDAGIDGDAGNIVSNARSISFPGLYQGFLSGDPPQYSDFEDWYRFQVTDPNIESVHVIMQPPAFVDFDLEVYNPNDVKYELHQGAGYSEGVTAPSIPGFWKVRVYRVSGSGVYSFTLNTVYPGGGGGCPYVFVWDGQNYRRDNNILPASEDNNGTDVQDYYNLEQPMSPRLRNYPYEGFSLYTIQMREFEHEHGWIDQIKLYAIDHESSVIIALTPHGETLTYQNPLPPQSCIDNHGNDRTSKICAMDGDTSNPSTYFEGSAGDWLILDFGSINASNAKLILRDDYKCMDVCIEVQTKNLVGEWNTVETLHPRDNWSIEGVNLTAYLPASSELMVRLLWTSTHRLDYVGLDTSPQASYNVRQAALLCAAHTEFGNVRHKLLYNDEDYTELLPGQVISLGFAIRDTEETRTFVYYSEGHYETIS